MARRAEIAAAARALAEAVRDGGSMPAQIDEAASPALSQPRECPIPI